VEQSKRKRPATAPERRRADAIRQPDRERDPDLDPDPDPDRGCGCGCELESDHDHLRARQARRDGAPASDVDDAAADRNLDPTRARAHDDEARAEAGGHERDLSRIMGSMRWRPALAALLIASASPASVAWADEDPMAVYRQQFKEGLDAYQAGRFADAILKWQPIYEQLGPKKAYRLSFNLARAYEAYGDITRAAERYEQYIDEVQARRAAGEALEPVVENQEAEARESLAQLVAKQARIRVKVGPKPTMVQVDSSEPRLAPFTAYVRPGAHTVTFAPGTSKAVAANVNAEEGKIVELEPPVIPEETRVVVVQPKTRTETVHPFPQWVVWTGVGVTVLSGLIPAGAYRKAMDTKTKYDASTDHAERERLANNYEQQKNTAYVTWAFPIAFGVATIGLAVWYAAGTTKREFPIAIGPDGVHGAF
jgi:tetratricopeptide (TPR) repeat protein